MTTHTPIQLANKKFGRHPFRSRAGARTVLLRTISAGAIASLILAADPLAAAAVGSHPVTLQVRIHDAGHALVTSVQAGSPVHLRVTVFADIKGDPTPTGHADVTYYTDGACTTAGGSRSGMLLNGTAEPAGEPVVPSRAGAMSFRASYGGDTLFAGATSACHPLTVTKATPTITLWFEKDGVKTTTGVVGQVSARLTIGAAGVATASGPFRMQLYRDATCTASGGYTNTYLVNGQYLATYSLSSAGEYSANATYEGDANFLPGQFSGCARVTISRTTPIVTTRVHDAAHASITKANAGDPVHPYATIVSTDTLPASGTMRAQSFLDGTCTTPSGSPVEVAIGSTLGTVDMTGLTIPATSGTRSFRVDYLGNNRLAPVHGSCAAYTVTGTTASPTAPPPTPSLTPANPSASTPTAPPTQPVSQAPTPTDGAGAPIATGVTAAPAVTAGPAITAGPEVAAQPAITAGPATTASPPITAGPAGVVPQPSEPSISPVPAAGAGVGGLLPVIVLLLGVLAALSAAAFIAQRRRHPVA